MTPGPDYIVQVGGLRPDGTPIGHGAPFEPAAQTTAEPDAAGPGVEGGLRDRPWLAVRWRCCEVYSRVYRNAQGTHYDGRCPRCARPVRAVVGEGGTDQRFFEAQ
jgi:hypothetical protein